MADPGTRAGERQATPELLRWVDGLHAPHDRVLARAFDAALRDGLPPIQVGPAEGRLLGLVATLVGARRIVEVGTLAGYSTLWLARALPPGGRLWSVELEPRHAEVARRNVREAGLEDRVAIVIGAAAEVLAGLGPEGPFDLVFLDADKGSYDRYAAWARANLRPGGILLADNAYYFGKLLDETPEACAMRRFHEETARSMASVCIPTPDGLLLARMP